MSQKSPHCLFGHVQSYPFSSVYYLSDGWDAMHHAQRRRFIPADSWRKHNVGPNCRDESGLWGKSRNMFIRWRQFSKQGFKSSALLIEIQMYITMLVTVVSKIMVVDERIYVFHSTHTRVETTKMSVVNNICINPRDPSTRTVNYSRLIRIIFNLSFIPN